MFTSEEGKIRWIDHKTAELNTLPIILKYRERTAIGHLQQYQTNETMSETSARKKLLHVQLSFLVFEM